MPRPLSMSTRATLAIALMVGFYAIAIGFALLLFSIPVLMFMGAGRVNIWIIVGCIAGGGAVLKGVFAAPPEFQPPGPKLDRDEHPRLFALIDDIARATNQPAPSEVYLLGEMNAWVSTRRVRPGRRTRIMGLGLPLLGSLSIDELRAVLAHEFGHYASGDTKLLPFIYRTRITIQQTIAGMDHEKLIQQFAAWMFTAYGKLFLRITHAVSRQQEFVADQVAARVAGAPAAISALRELAMSSVTYDAFLENCFMPALNAGRLPPLIEGLRSCRAAPGIHVQVQAVVAQNAVQASRNPYDTHPTLRERIAALAPEMPAGELQRLITEYPLVARESYATELLGDVVASERTYAAFRLRAELPPISWQRIADEVFLPAWKGILETATPVRQLRAADLPALIREDDAHPGTLGDFTQFRGEGVSVEQRRSSAEFLIGCAIASALDGLRAVEGTTVSFTMIPGEAITARVANGRGQGDFLPFGVVDALRDGSLTEDVWLGLCAGTGLDVLIDGPLPPVVAEGGPISSGASATTEVARVS